MGIGGMLQVRDKLRGRSGSLEKYFEKRVAQVLTSIGLENRHTSDRQEGIPDRYVVGGNWIEFKVVPCSGRRSVDPERLFTPAQRNFLSRWTEKGDRTWAAVMFQPDNDKSSIIILPWSCFKGHGKWSMAEVHERGVDGGGLRQYISDRFGRGYSRFSNWEKYDAR